MRLEKALVTGATRGIGFCIAKGLLEAGYKVTITGTSAQGKGPKGCSYLACDFLNKELTRGFADKIADLELGVLVNNAGVNKIGPVNDYPVEDFEKIQQVNVTAPFLLCQAVVPGMCQRKFGRIVNITSILGVVSRPSRSAYSTSKFGLLGLSKALALEVAKDNVLVNCVAPGFIDTDLTRQILGEAGIAEMVKKIPMGRLGTPEEIAHSVKFLVSEENTYMTGQTIIVDGGFTCE